MKQKTAVITGGAGFIGSRLTQILESKNFKTIVYDDFSNASGLTNLPKKTSVVKGSIMNYNNLKSVVRKADVVFNLAVLPLPMSFTHPDKVVNVNGYGTFLVAKACSNFNVKMIHISSSEVYGTARSSSMKESHLLTPTTTYAASKVSSEAYVNAFGVSDKLEYVIVRPFNSYGEYMREDGYAAAMPNFYERISKSKKPIITSDGEQTRDLCYVDDTARGIFLASKSRNAIGKTINIGQGKEISINKLAIMMIEEYEKLTGKKLKRELQYTSDRKGDVRRHKANISLAKNLLNYSPTLSIREGVKKYLEWKINK